MIEQHALIELEEVLAEHRRLNAEHAKLLAEQKAMFFADSPSFGWTAWWQPLLAGAVFSLGTIALTVVMLKYS